MKDIAYNNRHEIKYRHITGQDPIEAIRQLFLEYEKSIHTDLCFQNFEEEVKGLPGKYAPPDGALILASVDNKPAGCAALRKISEDVCEMKRLYVRDGYRGMGIGRKLIDLILEEASVHRYHYIRLDTLSTMERAQNLYCSVGFYDIEPYVYNPISGARFMELKL